MFSVKQQTKYSYKQQCVYFADDLYENQLFNRHTLR